MQVAKWTRMRTVFGGACFFVQAFATLSAAEGLAPVRCLIEPYEVADLSAPTAGLLAEIAVDRGDVVTKGQFLARLDTTLEQIQLRHATARAENESIIAARTSRLNFLEQQAERLRALSERNVTARAQLDEAMMEAEVARQELEDARLEAMLADISAAEFKALLDQKTLSSPVDGVVVERNASVGEYQDGTEPILTIAVLDPLRVEAFVPIDYFSELAVGQTVTVAPEAPIGGRFAATVSVVDRVFDAGTGTVGVRIDLPNRDNALPAGLRCMVEFLPE